MKALSGKIVFIVSLALLAHLGLSWLLWNSGSPSRTFPMAPVLTVPGSGNAVWLSAQAWCTLPLLLFSAAFPGKRYLPAVLLGWFAWLVLQDQNRLQPWLYFYALCLALLLPPEQHEARMRSALQWLLAAVYFWGGFNKLTPYFAVDNFPWFCAAFSWTQPLGNYPFAGYSVAVLEILFGLGLLWRRSRSAMRWVVIGFHLFITAALSPAGLNWNHVVIPWNLAMAALVWVLFKTGPEASKEPGGLSFLSDRTRISLVVLVSAWVMPALNIFHLWDEPLSWKMYCNTQTEASLYCDTGAPCSFLKPVWQQKSFDAGRRLLIDDWAISELNVPAYNSRRTFRRIAQYLCACPGSGDSLQLNLLSVERWDKSAEQVEEIRICLP